MIRAATMDDLPALMRLAGDMHLESRYAHRPLNEGKLAKLFVRLVTDQDGFLWVAVGDDGVTIGALAAMAFEHWCHDVRVAMDFGLFLHPNHRGGLAAARLVKQCMAWATDMGVELDMGVTTGVEPEKTGRFLQCLGFKPAGTLYTMER